MGKQVVWAVISPNKDTGYIFKMSALYSHISSAMGNFYPIQKVKYIRGLEFYRAFIWR